MNEKKYIVLLFLFVLVFFTLGLWLGTRAEHTRNREAISEVLKLLEHTEQSMEQLRTLYDRDDNPIPIGD